MDRSGTGSAGEVIDTTRAARVAVRGLSKAYAGRAAVAELSFSIGAGEVLGLLGPNGAGKTTTLEASAGLLRADAGVIEICGIDLHARPRDAKRRLGVALQATGLQDGITPAEALKAFAALYGAPADVAPLLQRFGLAAKADTRVAQLSGGERQRVALALALVNDPAVLFLDEPTAQLDPQMRHEFHEHIRALRGEGRAVLLATHDMQEAHTLCDRLLVLDAGRIVAEGTPAELVAGATDEIRVQLRTSAPVAVHWLAGCAAIVAPVSEELELRFTTTSVNAALAQLTQVLDARDVTITELQAGRGGLEDLILQLIRLGAR